MHVLQLGPYPPPQGGVNRNMLAIREELHKNGHQCSIIATAKSKTITPEPDVYHPRNPFELVKLLFQINYDVLHLHVGGDVSSRVLGLIFVCGLFRRGKNILTLHSGAYPQTKAGLAAKRNSIRGFLFRRFSRIIAVNSKIRDVFELYGVDSNRLKTIFPFVLRRPDAAVAVPANLREFAEKHDPFLLTVGLLEPDYDLVLQIEALEKILTKFPSGGLMIVGSGSLEDEIRRAVVAKPYANRILIAGDIDHAITLHLIHMCDILLRTTLFDGDAISVREALFLGKNVIATDNGMRPQGVHLMPVGDAESLVSEVFNAINSPLTKLSFTGDDTKNVDDILKLYEELN